MLDHSVDRNMWRGRILQNCVKFLELIRSVEAYIVPIFLEGLLIHLIDKHDSLV